MVCSARGNQRTDATHVLAVIRTLNRLECLGETLAHTLHHLLRDAASWACASIPPDWWERYAQRFAQFRLRATAPKRQALAELLGSDGRQLLAWASAPAAPSCVQTHPAVTLLRQVWIQQFYADERPLRLRSEADLPPAALLITSPYDADARFSTKRETTWNGDKVHLTETCDEEGPNLITDVQTTPATTADVSITPLIQRALAERDLLPSEHYVDSAYPDAELLVNSQQQQIELVGPVHRDTSWQAQANQGYAVACFGLDWEAQPAVCPQGQQSRVWSASQDEHGNAVIHLQFERKVCGACAVRAACTRAKEGPRTLKVRPQAQHEALQAARARQETREFKQRYRLRAGVEGTLAQGVRECGLRATRYRGLAKTALQHIISALALNLIRLVAWWERRPKAQTRSSRFAAAMRRASGAPCAGA